ncbi:MAG: ATP-binding protein [Candidatus Aramenus sulfurataquae]|jgi:AAA+ ATPase superfamily predicted ATPase|uniref:ATP-binding protein n=2 Tax=Candidatus Aramenus sulfurataquae TaxID=1326980 RepID=A0A0F2LTS4_9CREN|nr:ATP-binding protein [Candidatus Aramenus sulfurataquae]
MLFDLTPKEDRRDFFDREREIESVKSLSSPITLVLGLRRTGKSSVLRIALNELGVPSVYVDLRKFEDRAYIPYKDFLLEVEKEVRKLTKRFPSLFDFLRGIKGVNVAGNGITFNWGKKDRLNFGDLLEALNDWAEERVVVAFDEAQDLINLRGADLLNPLAYTFDNLRKVKMVMSGSEMRLLYRFLGVDNPKSPLFGRAMNEVELKPFTREESVEFLRRGFEEAKVEFREHERAYEELGGIPGWLTYFGYYHANTRDFDESVRRTIRRAKELVLEEFENFLSKRPIARGRYLAIMRKVAEGCSRWSEIKRALELHEGREINDSEVYNYINSLMESSWIVKDEEKEVYCPAEKLIARAFKD